MDEGAGVVVVTDEGAGFVAVVAEDGGELVVVADEGAGGEFVVAWDPVVQLAASATMASNATRRWRETTGGESPPVARIDGVVVAVYLLPALAEEGVVVGKCLVGTFRCLIEGFLCRLTVVQHG